MRTCGITLNRSIDPEITYTHFNMQEKIGNQPNPVAGFSKEKIALRQSFGATDAQRRMHWRALVRTGR